LYTLKLTRKQVISLTIHTDSPFIRALGFMYIRYTQPPNELFEWFEEYLDDPETLDVKAGGGGVMSIGQMLRQWLTRIEWYDTLFPRIPVPVQKEIMERLHAHGPYKGDSYGENSRYDYEDEQYESKSSNAIDMPETFGNAASSSKDRNGTYNQHYSSSSDSHRDKKYRSSRDDRERSRSSDRRRHHERYDNSDRYKSHKHHHHRRSSSREDQRRHHHRSRSPDDRYRNDKRGRP
ncbi:unnamed protein product, partial [Rotaria magnacalcarata]